MLFLELTRHHCDSMSKHPFQLTDSHLNS